MDLIYPEIFIGCDHLLIGKENFCDFQTIQTAVNHIEKQKREDEWLTIYILEGTYKERVVIRQSKVRLIGIGEVVISYDAHANQKDLNGNEIGTFNTSTLYLEGEDIHLENITVENTSGQGEIAGQAIALYADCDKSTFKQCTFRGFQDTLFTPHLPPAQKDGSVFQENQSAHHQYRQHYCECRIEGTVDFIFGGATAYFDRCIIKSRRRLNDDKVSYITAACTPQDQKFGYIFNECFLTAEEGCSGVYLGRPWRPYAKVQFQYCYMSDHIHLKRWNDWNNPDNRETAEFKEIHSVCEKSISLDLDNWFIFEESSKGSVSEKQVFDTAFYKRQ